MAKALWHQSKHNTILENEQPPLKQAFNCTIKSYYSLISTGTERLVARGEVPQSLQHSMRVPYMDGHFSFPLKYGYSLVGEIITEGHPDKGKLVHVMHPHQDECWLDAPTYSIIPDKIPASRACLASNVETAINAIWDSQISIGDKALVIGFGMIGSLLTRLLSQMPGVEVHVLEKNPIRQEQAKTMGFRIASEVEPGTFDFAFNTSASSGGLQAGIEALGLEGTVLELSWYGTKEANLNLGGSFHQQRKRIISSQVSIIPTQKSARWSYARRKQLVFELLQQEEFDQHISHIIPFEESPDLFKRLRNTPLDGIGYLISY